jgi:hypothetical protein
MRRWWCLLLAAGGAPALAAEPTFTFLPPDQGTPPPWKASAQVGLHVSGGNAQAFQVTASGAVARRWTSDRLALEALGAFTRSRVDVAVDTNGTAGIGPTEVRRIVQTTAKAWTLGARYDRFLAARQSLYGAATAGGDEPAGKRLLAGVQVGYSREVLRSGPHAIVAELGYDLSHQDYVASPRALTLQSVRAFAGYELAPAPVFALRAGLELLSNLAAETSPTGRVPAFEHARISGRLEVNVKAIGFASVGVRTRVRYDSNPAPRPPPPGAAWEAGYVPLADRLDATGELVLTCAYP